MNGDISFYVSKTFNKMVIPAEEKTMITGFEKGPDNSIWAGSYSNGFVIIDKKNKIKFIKTSEEDELIINTFKFLDKNKILIGTMNGLEIWKYMSNDKLERETQIKEIPQSKITDIIEIEKLKEYYIATYDKGIYNLFFIDNGYKINRIDNLAHETISGIVDLLHDNDSNLWVATFGNGLLKLDRNSNGIYSTEFQVSKKNGSSADYIKVVFEDRDGIIWYGNYGSGLGKITKELYSYSYYDKATIGNNILSIGIDKKFKWLGTEKGLLKTELGSGKLLSFFDQRNGLPNDKITAIEPVGSTIWIGTSKSGIFMFDTVLEKANNFFILSNWNFILFSLEYRH
jgi:ligand-binding sensor domain-containing protein